MKSLAHKIFSLAGVLLASGSGLWAVDLQTLVDRSPFTPAGAGEAVAAAEPQDTLEFRGIATDSEGTAYGIFDTATNKGRWLRADDKDSLIQVTGFDAASNTLEIERNGRPLRLSLKRATIQAGQTVAAMVPATPGAAGSGQIRRGAVNGLGRNDRVNKPATPADEARLKAVAEMVRKRREERMAGANRGSQAVRPAATPPPSGS